MRSSLLTDAWLRVVGEDPDRPEESAGALVAVDSLREMLALLADAATFVVPVDIHGHALEESWAV